MQIVKVKSTTAITFPKLGWAIGAGEIKELPEDKAAQERILREPEITLVDEENNEKPAKVTKQQK
jgi:hypothetical protein